MTLFPLQEGMLATEMGLCLAYTWGLLIAATTKARSQGFLGRCTGQAGGLRSSTCHVEQAACCVGNPESRAGSPAVYTACPAVCTPITFLPERLLLVVWALIEFCGSQWGVSDSRYFLL